MSSSYRPAVVGDDTGTYEATVLTPEDASELAGEYIRDEDMYFRGGVTPGEWIQLTGAVYIRPLDKEAGVSEVLLASEFNARFGCAAPVHIS